MREGSSEHALSALARCPVAGTTGPEPASRGRTRVGFCSLRGRPRATPPSYPWPSGRANATRRWRGDPTAVTARRATARSRPRPSRPPDPPPRASSVRGRLDDPGPQPYGAAEIADVPPLGLGLLPQLLVGVHRDRVPYRPQHREVGRGVAVGVRGPEVDPSILRERTDRLGLPFAVAVELELTRVAPVLDPSARRQHAGHAEVLRQRPDDLLR